MNILDRTTLIEKAGHEHDGEIPSADGDIVSSPTKLGTD